MAGDICSGILIGGAFDTVAFGRDASYKLKIRNYVLTASFESVNNARNYGLSVDAIVESLPIAVRGEFNEQNFRQWQQQSLQQYSLDETQAESVRYFQSRANPDIVAAWSRCVQSQPYTGLTAFADTLYDNLIMCYISWIPSPGDMELPRIRSITVTGGTVKNTATYPIGSELSLGYRVNILLVERDQQQPVVVVVSTTKGDVSVSSAVAPRTSQCATCHGLKRIECFTCKGQRRIIVPNAPDWARRVCPTCEGLGDVICPTCNGTGLYTA
jgi:hypothetical protein